MRDGTVERGLFQLFALNRLAIVVTALLKALIVWIFLVTPLSPIRAHGLLTATTCNDGPVAVLCVSEISAESD